MKKTTSKKKANSFKCLHHEKCSVLGYCVVAKEKEVRKQYLENTYSMSDDFIKEFVPWKADPTNFPYHVGEYSLTHLQTAFDAYHQQDYETAILHCKAIIAENFSCRIAYLCIISSEYFSGNYEDATYFATKVEELYSEVKEKQILRLFNLHCQNILGKKSISKEMATKKQVNEVKNPVLVCNH